MSKLLLRTSASPTFIMMSTRAMQNSTALVNFLLYDRAIDAGLLEVTASHTRRSEVKDLFFIQVLLQRTHMQCFSTFADSMGNKSVYVISPLHLILYSCIVLEGKTD